MVFKPTKSMKKVISALVAFVAISASASTYVTVTDCNGGETGTLESGNAQALRGSHRPRAGRISRG